MSIAWAQRRRLASRRRLLRTCLPSRCFLRGPKRSKSLSPEVPTGLLTVQGATPVCYGPCCVTSQLAHSDLHLFGSLKKHLAGKGFATDADVKQAVTSCLQTLDTYLFYAGTQVLVPRWVRYWNVIVDCRVVWCVPSATVCRVHIESEYGFWRQSVFLIVRLLKVHCVIVYTAEDITVVTCSLRALCLLHPYFLTIWRG